MSMRGTFTQATTRYRNDGEPMQEDGEAMLIDDAGRFNRAAIMAKAHHEFRLARMRGDGRGFGRWLAYSWRVAKSRRAATVMAMAA